MAWHCLVQRHVRRPGLGAVRAIDRGADLVPICSLMVAILAPLGALVLPPPNGLIDEAIANSIKTISNVVMVIVTVAVGLIGVGIATALILHVCYKHGLW